VDVSVHGLKVTSVQMGIEHRTGRGRGFALEWLKIGGRGCRAVGGLYAAISGTDFKGNSRHNSGKGDSVQSGAVRGPGSGFWLSVLQCLSRGHGK
jgi:hypothetical protein